MNQKLLEDAVYISHECKNCDDWEQYTDRPGWGRCLAMTSGLYEVPDIFEACLNHSARRHDENRTKTNKWSLKITRDGLFVSDNRKGEK